MTKAPRRERARSPVTSLFFEVAYNAASLVPTEKNNDHHKYNDHARHHELSHGREMVLPSVYA